MTPTELRQELTRVVKEERLFTLSKLAESAGSTRSHLSNFLNGKRELSPDLKVAVERTLAQLARNNGDPRSSKNEYLKFMTGLVRGFDLRLFLRSTAANDLRFVNVDRFFVPLTFKAVKRNPDEVRDVYKEGIDNLPRDRAVWHILGPAGSGKTTTIRHEILRLAEQQKGPLPIFLPLNALNRLLAAPQPPSENLLDLISIWYERASGFNPHAVIEIALQSGRAFVMLDGLDEVHPDYYWVAVDLINRFVRRYSELDGAGRNLFMVTERGSQPFGFTSPLESSAMFEILAFDERQINLLVDRWLGVFGNEILRDPSLLSMKDITNAPALYFALGKAITERNPCPGKRILELLTPQVRESLLTAVQTNDSEVVHKQDFVKALNQILTRRDFYRAEDFRGFDHSWETQGLLERDPINLSELEVERLNRLLLEESYPHDIVRSLTRYPKDRIDHFRESLVKPPLSELTGNPFFLTLLTLIFITKGIEEVFAKPAKATVLSVFFRTILGVWNNVRSVDGFPTPVKYEFHRELSQTILSHLAWEMVESGRDPSRTILSSGKAEETLRALYERYSSPSAALTLDDSLLQERTQNFITIYKDAGVLGLSQNEPGELTFFHILVRDWFITFQLRYRPHVLKDRIDVYITQPSPTGVKWRDPLALTLSAMGAVDENLDGVIDAIKFALKSYPLGDLALHKILPLSLELSLQFLDDGGSYPGIEKTVLRACKEFFEATEYAVVTDCLQPRMIRWLSHADWAYEIPREPSDLETWLENLSGKPKDVWVSEVDKIWRYQTDIRCFDILFRAVDERLRRGQDHEKLYRRFVFGMRNAQGDPETKINTLASIVRRPELNEVIRSMALYALKDTKKRLENETADQAIINRIERILREVNGSKHQETKIKEIKTSTVDNMVESLMPYHVMTLVESANSDLLNKFKRESGIDEAGIINGLLKIIERKGKRVNHRRRVIAIVLLANIFGQGIFNKSFGDLYPERFKGTYENAGDHHNVLRVLIETATVEDKEDQHENVDACQVYDFAAWAIRSIFLQTQDLSGLPLPPR